MPLLLQTPDEANLVFRQDLREDANAVEAPVVADTRWRHRYPGDADRFRHRAPGREGVAGHHHDAHPELLDGRNQFRRVRSGRVGQAEEPGFAPRPVALCERYRQDSHPLARQAVDFERAFGRQRGAGPGDDLPDDLRRTLGDTDSRRAVADRGFGALGCRVERHERFPLAERGNSRV